MHDGKWTKQGVTASKAVRRGSGVQQTLVCPFCRDLVIANLLCVGFIDRQPDRVASWTTNTFGGLWRARVRPRGYGGRFRTVALFLGVEMRMHDDHVIGPHSIQW